MSVFGIILVRIFPVFSRIRTEYGEIRSTNTFYAASRSTKIDYSPRNSLKIKQLTAFGKTEFDNATYGLYISLTTIFKNDNLKYIAMSQRRFINYFLLFYIFFPSLFSFKLSLFKPSCTKRHHVYNLYRISYILSFYYLMYCILTEICIGWRFLQDCFCRYPPKIICAVTNESLIAHKLIKRAPEKQNL